MRIGRHEAYRMKRHA